MTIPASMPAKVAYIGDGETVNFSVPFVYFANTDGTKQLKVILADADGENEVVQTENTDFTLTAAGESNGTLTMLAAPPKGYKLSIVYNIPIEQLTDWREFGRLPSESIETAFDKVTAILKQINEVLGRCIQVTVSTDASPDEVFEDFKEQMAELIASAQSSIAAAQQAVTDAQASALEAYKYAKSVTFGMEKSAIVSSDWQLSSGVYKIFFADAGVIDSVYKTTDTGAELMTNVDIQTGDSGTTIVAQAPFDGFALLVNMQTQQFIYNQTNASNRWVIAHNLGKYPQVQCINTDGVVMAGTIKHDSLNALHIDFTEDVSGTAVLS